MFVNTAHNILLDKCVLDTWMYKNVVTLAVWQWYHNVVNNMKKKKCWSDVSLFLNLKRKWIRFVIYGFWKAIFIQNE